MAISGSVRPDLPGFTYDKERGRYMRILPNHHAEVLGTAARAASASTVNDAVTYKKRRRKEEEEQLEVISRTQIQRSKIHKHAIVGMSLDRQTGIRKHFQDVYGQTWTHLVDPGWNAPILHTASWYIMKKTVRDAIFVGVMYISGHSPSTSSAFQLMDSKSPGASKSEFSSLRIGRVSSLNLTEKYAFLTTFSRDEPNRLIEIPEETNEESDYMTVSHNIGKADGQFDYWCTSFHPDISRPQIAVGSEHSILIHNPFCSHRHGMRTIEKSPSMSPVLSIQWKSENVIAAGFRDATVHLYDMRARDNVFRIRHSQAVMRLHCPDENKMLLGGPKQLSMYDLRYNKSPHAQRKSRPWLHYRNYDNTRWSSCDMDISPRLGLLALALESTTEIWNLWTGAKLRQLCSPSTTPDSPEKNTVISFTRPYHRPQFFVEESDPEGLLVVGPNVAREWSLNAGTTGNPEDISFVP